MTTKAKKLLWVLILLMVIPSIAVAEAGKDKDCSIIGNKNTRVIVCHNS